MHPEAIARLEECDRNKIEAALAAPAAGFGGYEKYQTLAAKASALMYAIAKGHPCASGNKRLAFVLTASFLAKNMHWLWAQSEDVINTIDMVAASDARQPDAVRSTLTQWMADRIMSAAQAAALLQIGLSPGEFPQ